MKSMKKTGHPNFNWIKRVLANFEGDRDEIDIVLGDLIARKRELVRDNELAQQASERWPLGNGS